MKTVLQILVVVTLGYLFWVYGRPWIQREVGQSRAPTSNPAKGAGGACVQAAAEASEALHDDMLDAGRALLDDASWERITSKVDDEIQQARYACSCRLESCVTAREALSRLSSVFSSAKGQQSASQSIPLELGRSVEQANQLLWSAYDLAKDDR